MSPRIKNALYSLLLLVFFLVVWKWRNQSEAVPIYFEGETMATTYKITYYDNQQRNFKGKVDSLFVLINKSINTYDSTSDISRFNRSEKGISYIYPHLFVPLTKSREVFRGSEGSYDPTVMPLVNAWGFGPQKVTKPDTAVIEKVKSFVGFDKIDFNQDSVWKSSPNVQLDFSAIGQGYGADVVADFFRSVGIVNFFIELGGEGVASGKNLKTGEGWLIGILHPDAIPGINRSIAYTKLNDTGYSTSGSYFNFRIVDGKKYSHTIDPATGYPVNRPLVSATVFASDCATADAWATALMTMGHEKAQIVLKSHPELKAFLVFTSDNGWSTWMSPELGSSIEIAKEPQ